MADTMTTEEFQKIMDVYPWTPIAKVHLLNSLRERDELKAKLAAVQADIPNPDKLGDLMEALKQLHSNTYRAGQDYALEEAYDAVMGEGEPPQPDPVDPCPNCDSDNTHFWRGTPKEYRCLDCNHVWEPKP